MNIAIVKYNAGNIYSVVNALRRLGVEPLLTDDADQLRKADGVLFPGQGEARGAMEYLHERGLDEVIRSLKQPVFGICVGQQLLCRHSEEGNVDCIGIFDTEVKRFLPPSANQEGGRVSELFKGILSPTPMAEPPYVYFVHSYYVPLCADTIAAADYIQPYSAAIQKDNFYACQFHPEKSGDIGEQILKNFLEIARR